MSLPLHSNSEPVPTQHYRALCPTAVVSIVIGTLSIPTLVFWFSWLWAVMPLVGIGLGWHAAQRIRQAPSEWTGLGLARLGIGLSAGLWIAGYGWLIFAGVRGVPYGYTLVRYDQLQSDPNAPAEPIPQSARELHEKKIFIKGYMQPRRQQTGIKEFILCPTNGECPFCIPNPKRTEMIRVVLQGDLETVFTTHLIGVGGRFQVDTDDRSGIPYGLEADCLQ
jgi:hypothetical protein